MEDKEKKVYLTAKLRNLKRKYAKMIRHSDLVEECIELKAEIDSIDKEIKFME